jgi:hypothetical protein
VPESRALIQRACHPRRSACAWADTGRIASVALGICLTAGSILWTFIWGAFALLEVESEARCWLVLAGALTLMAPAIFLGIRQRGRFPTRRGWSAWAALIVALFALLLLVDSADHDPSQVNRAVEGVYVKRPHVRRAKANFTEGEPNPDGSE